MTTMTTRHALDWIGQYGTEHSEWDYLCECGYEATGFEDRDAAESHHEQHAAEASR